MAGGAGLHSGREHALPAVPAAPADDERDLVARAAAEPEAFAALYRRYVGRVHAFAFRRTGSREVAEDVTASTFERALRHLDSFNWRDGGFAPWLFRIAANELADHYRREYRSRSGKAQAALRAMQPAVADGGYDEIDRRLDEPVEEVLTAMNRLTPRYQRVLALRFLSGLSLDDAAAAMGCSKPLMSVTVHRALAALRKAMAAQGGQEAAG